jgi:predicted choloylglycine hydrolase
MHEMIYKHCIAEGAPYKLGYQLGTQLREDKKLISDLTTPMFGHPLPQKQIEETADLFEKYIPGINDEIKGFSEAANVSYTDMVIYSSYISVTYGCSHFTALREDKQQGIIHARNYDYDLSEPPVLITARTEGKNHNTGFGCKIFGRFDGMNEKGLCVTTSSVDLRHTGRMGKGFVFPMVVRAILELCACVYDAKEMLMGMPYAEYRNFLLSERSGSALLVEASPDTKEVKSIKVNRPYNYLCSSNHFTLIQNAGLQPVKNSVKRQRKMEEFLSDKRNIAIDSIQAFLAKRYPDGLAFPYYNDGMGTMWSVIYEPASFSQLVCFGSPESGTWRAINRDGAAGCTETTVTLNDVKAPEDLWK